MQLTDLLGRDSAVSRLDKAGLLISLQRRLKVKDIMLPKKYSNLTRKLRFGNENGLNRHVHPYIHCRLYCPIFDALKDSAPQVNQI